MPRRWWLILSFSLVAAAAIYKVQATDTTPKVVATDPYASAWNRKQVDSALQKLQPGDIVLRMGKDVTSYLFSRFNLRDKSFSHCGIVFFEGGKPVVYHSIGGEDNPDEELRRDAALRWLSPTSNLSFAIIRYPLGSCQVDSLNQVVRKYYREKKRFDMRFDLNSDDRFYCAEFVYKALAEALKDENPLKPYEILGHRYVAIDNLYRNTGAAFICRVKFK